MKILDCTLRDGGFKNKFNWDIGFASRYYKLVSKFKIPYIELGYWKQTSKSTNPFYNMDLSVVNKIVGDAQINNVCVIIDYHYCSKNLDDYPIKGETPIAMIRMTSRKENLQDAIKFGNKLIEKTQLDVSFQIINATNYSKNELNDALTKLSLENFFYVYFADSHGNLNLANDFWKFEDSIKICRDNGQKIGFHLHNHTDRALLNFHYCKEKNIDITDTSILGLGKGGGNLKLESIIINENFIELLNFIEEEKKHLCFENSSYLFFLISGRLNITDNYAVHACKLNLSLSEFYRLALLIRGQDKDIFNKEHLLEKIN